MTNSKEDRDVLLSIFSDTYKDVYGVRPRGAAFPSGESYAEIERQLAILQSELEQEMAHEEEERELFEEFWDGEVD